MEKNEKAIILFYSVYSLIKISNSNCLRLFDVLKFMNYLKHIYPDVSVYNKEEIIEYLKYSHIIRIYIDKDGCYYLYADKAKLNEYINNNKEPFLISLYNKAEVFVWDMLYCDGCEFLKEVEHKDKHGWTGIDCDLYCDRYKKCVMESIMPGEATNPLKLKECH